MLEGGGAPRLLLLLLLRSGVEAERKSKRKKKNLLRVITTLRFYSTHLFLFIFSFTIWGWFVGYFPCLVLPSGLFWQSENPFWMFWRVARRKVTCPNCALSRKVVEENEENQEREKERERGNI